MMDKIQEVVEELFGLHYNTNLEGMNDMVSKEYFMTSFNAELSEKINTQDVWVKTMENLKSEEDKDDAWYIHYAFLQEKFLRIGK